VTACIGEPISWPRLEQFVLEPADPAIASHVDACPACRHCLEQLRADVVELPPLVVMPHARAMAEPLRDAALDARRPERRSDRSIQAGQAGQAGQSGQAARAARPIRRWLVPAVTAVAAAIVLVVVLRPPAPDVDGFTAPIGIKGVGEVTLELVRERAGTVVLDARRYAPGDRWKIAVTCPPRPSLVAIDVSVADGVTTDHPLAPAQVACGNRVVVPGAFTVTGARANRVCVTIAATPGAEAGTACATLRPE
jgi:hypothetical protein